LEGIHISLVICVRGYTYHGDTHITVTPALVMRDKEFWGCDLQVENVS